VENSPLADLQRRFWKLISAPSGVQDAVPRLSQDDPGIAPLDRWVKAPDADFAAQRLDIYANMYFYRLLDVLAADYPKTKAITGDANFHNLVTDYLLAHPSQNPSLRYAGEQLPEFLATHALSQTWPFLSELAALEWTRISVFDVEDFAPLAREALAEIPPERWGELLLRAGPALRVLRTTHPVHRVWLAVEQTETVPEVAPLETWLAVWRKNLIVYHRPLSANEGRALEQLLAGVPFGVLCECFAEGDDLREAAGRAVQALGRWLDDELLCGAGLPNEDE
jgi:Putative DNA-binding domain